MKVKSIKEAEWIILNFLITGEGGNLSDVLDIYDIDDSVQLKRFTTASDNIRTVLVNMRSKRDEPQEA